MLRKHVSVKIEKKIGKKIGDFRKSKNWNRRNRGAYNEKDGKTKMKEMMVNLDPE
jgi:hypothetical protein